MTTELAILFFVAGLGALWLGGEAIVRSTMSFAKMFKVGAFVLSLTLLAAATSGPELFFNIFASVQGESSSGIGNVLGANIANLALIFAIATLLLPLKHRDEEAIWAYPSLLGFSLFFLLLGIDGTIGRIEGVLLVLLFFAWMAFALQGEHKKRIFEKLGDMIPEHKERKHKALTIGLFIVSIILLAGGAELLVRSVKFAGAEWDVSPILFSALVISLGTTLPEFATALVAVFKKRYDIRSGSLFGSNIFNISLIVGVAAIIHPIEFSQANFLFLSLVMMIATMLSAPIIFNFRFHNRMWSALLFVTYLFFLAFISTELIF